MHRFHHFFRGLVRLLAVSFFVGLIPGAFSSSHREAPNIARMPNADNTDLLAPDPRDIDRLCVTLTSSTSPDPATFDAVEGAYVDPAVPDKVFAPLPGESTFYLFETDEVFIESVARSGNELALLLRR